MWDPAQYERYRDERSRPFLDLLARIDGTPSSVVDLGCGTGELTRVLVERWPAARVVGVDTSDEMLAAAAPRAVPGRVDFVKGDAASWRPGAPVDLVVSNATFQWVPDHERLLPHLARMLTARGTLAVQMPANFDEPSHRILAGMASRLAGWCSNAENVRPLAWYVRRLHALGFEVDAWETTYQHVLRGDDAVLEWMKGTALRPVLALLPEGEVAAFLAEYGARLRTAYPAEPHGTLLPFRRLFFVARRGA